MSKQSKIILISALALLLAALIAVLGIVIFGGKDNNDKDSASSVDSKTESTVSKTDTPAIYDREETTPNENENVSKIEIDKTKPSVTVENYETALGKTIEIPVKINNKRLPRHMISRLAYSFQALTKSERTKISVRFLY